MRARTAWLGALAAGLFALIPRVSHAQEVGPTPFPTTQGPGVTLPSGVGFEGPRTAPSPVRFDAAYTSVLDYVFQELRSLTEVPPSALSAIGQPAPTDLLMGTTQPPSWVPDGVPPDGRFGVHVGLVTGQPVAFVVPPPISGQERFSASVLPSLVVPLPFLP